MELPPAVHHYLPKFGIIYSHNFCLIIRSYELLLKISISLVTSAFENILVCFLYSGTGHFWRLTHVPCLFFQLFYHFNYNFFICLHYFQCFDDFSTTESHQQSWVVDSEYCKHLLCNSLLYLSLMHYPEQTLWFFSIFSLLSTPIFHLLVWVLSRKILPNQSPIYLLIISSINCITYLCVGIRKGHIYVLLVKHISS
jgi:hypothetical protein